MSNALTKSSLSIAITTNTLNQGGAEVQRVALANAMTNLGHRVTLYCLQSRGAIADRVDPGVLLIDRHYYRPTRGDHDVIVSGTTNTECAFAFLSRAISRDTRWLVAIHNPVGTGAPNLSRFAAAGVRLCDATIALTPAHADAIRDLWKIEPDYIISNGLDSVQIHLLTDMGHDRSREYEIGFLGRLALEHKGLDRLLRALAQPALSACRLALAGDGPDATKLKLIADEIGVSDRITWLGETQPRRLLHKVGVLCVLSRYEAQPMVLLEAEAARVNVVASKASGAISGPGVLVLDDADDSRATASAIAGLLAHEGARENSEPRRAYDMAAEYIAAINVVRSVPRPDRSRPRSVVVALRSVHRDAQK